MKDEEEEDIYKLKEKREEELKERAVFERFDDVVEEPEVVEKRIKSKVGMPALEQEPITKLQRVAPEIVGNLFDRVKFLDERIKEVKDIIKTREDLHNMIMKEIDSEIKEKEEIASRVADIDEKRNLKLDATVLRKEKRHEIVQFWKDVTELGSELTELTEKFEVEKKITDLFKELGDEK